MDDHDEIPRPAQRSAIFAPKKVGSLPKDEDEYESMEIGDTARSIHRMGGATYSTSQRHTQMIPLAHDDDDFDTACNTPARIHGGAHEIRKRIKTETSYMDDKSIQKNEWDASGSKEAGENFALGVEVFVPLHPHVFSNILMLATVMLGLIAISRGILSLVASVSDITINMDHLHIIDTVVFVFGAFMLGSGVSFFYIQDYMETTYRHKVTVLKPYMASVFVYGAAAISMWTFTRDHGSHVDRNDFIELMDYTTTHVLYTIGSIIVLMTIPDALYAHRYPESESHHKYSIIPRPGYY